MPYQWVEPELFLEHNSVAVYHCYDDGGQKSWYWYTSEATDDNYDWTPADTAQFDVRSLPNGGLDANDRPNHGTIIRQAIDAGLVSGEPALKPAPPGVVRLEVLGGVATVLDKPPGVKVEIIDRDQDEDFDSKEEGNGATGG